MNMKFTYPRDHFFIFMLTNEIRQYEKGERVDDEFGEAHDYEGSYVRMMTFFEINFQAELNDGFQNFLDISSHDVMLNSEEVIFVKEHGARKACEEWNAVQLNRAEVGLRRWVDLYNLHPKYVYAEKMTILFDEVVQTFKDWFEYNNIPVPSSLNKEDILVESSIQNEKGDQVRRKKDKSLIPNYISAIKQLKIASPILEDLERVSGISVATWSRHLKDYVFLAGLRKELIKRQSGKYSKTSESKQMWEKAEKALDELIFSLPQQKDPLKKKTVPYDDAKKPKSSYEDLSEEYNKSIDGK